MATDLLSRIQQGRKRIAERFLDQCLNGAQSKSLPDTASACGQRIGMPALCPEQRGLHGTAAALRVLGQAPNKQERALLAKLVHYVQNRADLEIAALRDTTQADTVRAKCALDSSNVIKLSELLYSLSFVPADVPGRSGLIESLAGTLRQAKMGDRGWSYFTTAADDSVELLPTAYAVLSLRRNRISVNGPARYLFNHLTSRAISQESRDESDVMIDVACLYALVFSERPNGRAHEQEYRKMLSRLWRPLYGLLEPDAEHNVEYGSYEAYYVRVPWQLYLLALSAELDFFWKFRRVRATRCLNRALDQTVNGGLMYPHFSRDVSTRTSAALFDALGHIERHCDSARLAVPINIVDRLQSFLGSPWVRWAVFLVAGSIGLYAITQWLEEGGTLADIGPELIGALFGLMFALGARRNPEG